MVDTWTYLHRSPSSVVTRTVTASFPPSPCCFWDRSASQLLVHRCKRALIRQDAGDRLRPEPAHSRWLLLARDRQRSSIRRREHGERPIQRVCVCRGGCLQCRRLGACWWCDGIEVATLCFHLEIDILNALGFDMLLTLIDPCGSRAIGTPAVSASELWITLNYSSH